MLIEPYEKIPTEHGDAVYPTVEEFCNSHFGDEYIIVHGDEFEYYDAERGKYVLDKQAEILFVHRSDYRACSYLPKKWWMAEVHEWRIYEDGIHIRITEWEGD